MPTVKFACPNCFKQMENLGNVTGTEQASNPPQWDEVWICRGCRLKKTQHVIGERKQAGPPADLDQYKEI